MSGTLLKVEDLQTKFRAGKITTLVVDGVSLDLEPGEIIGLVGESGSGKSVTMLSTIQLLPGTGFVSGGRVELDGDGKNLINYSPKSNEMRKIRGGRIGMIFQEPMTSLNPIMKVGEQIRESIMLHQGLSAGEAKKKAIEMMDLVAIPDAEKRYAEYPMQFSGGMRQRIMIAMVLAGQPDILVADEATTALDVTIQAQILETIRDLSLKTGISVIIVTHNLGIIARYAQRIYVMYAGGIVEQGMSAEIFHSPQHPYTRGLLNAIPRLDDPVDRVLIPIPGMPPMPQNRPQYCPFYDRCLYRHDRCLTLPKPELVEYEEGHFFACHLDENEKKAKKEEIDRQVHQFRPEKIILDEVCLEVNNLIKSFDVTRGFLQKKIAVINAVDDISFKIRKGETLGVVGESGCGKTTLGRTIMRMYTPSSGEIKLFGTNIASMNMREIKPYRKQMSMIFQDPFSSLDPRMSVGAIVAQPLKISKICKSTTEIYNRVNELFELVGLDTSMRERFPHEFSGGQRQRIGIARALASNPALMICDEPISALDVSIQAQITNLLEELQSKFNLAYLFIAHDLAVVKHISDKILVMYLGRVMEVALSSDIYENPMHPYTKALLSAVPVADPLVEKTRSFIGLQGEVPSVFNRPKGCPFNNRCSYAQERCFREVPQLKEVGKEHTMACFL
ncbi:MAG: ABC transporter ATP-binding protein [Clostridiales bacterium]|nr:ABC transporter ATP-binding protein [Clostridiales bacterium]